MSLPTKTHQKKETNPTPPFGHGHFHVSHYISKKKIRLPRSASSFIPVMALAPQQDEAGQKTWLLLMVFSDKKSLGGPEEKGTCRSWTSMFFFEASISFLLFFLLLFFRRCSASTWKIVGGDITTASITRLNGVETTFIWFRNGWVPGKNPVILFLGGEMSVMWANVLTCIIKSTFLPLWWSF